MVQAAHHAWQGTPSASNGRARCRNAWRHQTGVGNTGADAVIARNSGRLSSSTRSGLIPAPAGVSDRVQTRTLQQFPVLRTATLVSQEVVSENPSKRQRAEQRRQWRHLGVNARVVDADRLHPGLRNGDTDRPADARRKNGPA